MKRLAVVVVGAPKYVAVAGGRSSSSSLPTTPFLALGCQLSRIWKVSQGSTSIVDGISDSEMVFDEMRLRIRHRLPDIRLTVGENLGKTQPEKEFPLPRLFHDAVQCSLFTLPRRDTNQSPRRLTEQFASRPLQRTAPRANTSDPFNAVTFPIFMIGNATECRRHQSGLNVIISICRRLPVQNIQPQRRLKNISFDIELTLVETVRLNSVTILDALSDILDYVKSLHSEMLEIKNENAALKIQMAEILDKRICSTNSDQSNPKVVQQVNASCIRKSYSQVLSQSASASSKQSNPGTAKSASASNVVTTQLTANEVGSPSPPIDGEGFQVVAKKRKVRKVTQGVLTSSALETVPVRAKMKSLLFLDSVRKLMVHDHRKVHCVLRLVKFDPVIRVRQFRHLFKEESPHENNFRFWNRQLKETGSQLEKKRTGRPSTNDETVEAIRRILFRVRRNEFVNVPDN
ncbi:hypothetical protein ANN_23578 [Periplaneta americana]|uniref:DUF4817 domain-containing protein n=1 Tax=Periplaneta americana TaxID=6978 RepID=A0ABQ8SMN9_PERAM|nr:hypothetical protein ANN_23578 [Periplaneta americana]